ncbi:Diacetyl reductase [(S)-acetoin forming] [compost metagenome]
MTGGGAGIGAAIASAFYEIGAKVYICDINASFVDQMKKKHPNMHGEVLDVCIQRHVDRIMEDAEDILGGLDLLVTNASIAGPTARLENIDPDEWEQTIATNLNSQFLFIRKAIPLLKKSSENPSIIAMASVAGRMGYSLRTAYSTSKWAVIGLMKSLANELGPFGVRVNAILPGAVEGERMEHVLEARAAAYDVSVDEMREQFLQKISLRRLVCVEDVAAVALFLASPAGRNITGQAINVDGNVEYL